MSHLAKLLLPNIHLLSEGMTESALTKPSGIKPQAKGIVLKLYCLTHTNLYLHVHMEGDYAPPPTLFYYYGISGMCISREAEDDEVAQAGTVPEIGGLSLPQEDNETRFFRMMKDIHILARQPNGDALRIPNFSGAIPPGKGEESFTQRVYPEGVRRSWITRSLRESPAETVRSLGEHVLVRRSWRSWKLCMEL